MVNLRTGEPYITLVTVEGVASVGVRVVGSRLTGGGCCSGLRLCAPGAVKPSWTLNTLRLI